MLPKSFQSKRIFKSVRLQYGRDVIDILSIVKEHGRVRDRRWLWREVEDRQGGKKLRPTREDSRIMLLASLARQLIDDEYLAVDRDTRALSITPEGEKYLKEASSHEKPQNQRI